MGGRGGREGEAEREGSCEGGGKGMELTLCFACGFSSDQSGGATDAPPVDREYQQKWWTAQV